MRGKTKKAEFKQTAFLVEDDAALTAQLSELFDQAGIPCRSYASAEAFLEAWRAEFCGCLLLGARLPGLSGLQLQARLVEMQVETPVVLIAGRATVAMAREAFKAGVFDFLPKPLQSEELLRTVDQAFILDRERRVVAREREEIRARVASLKKREREVIEQVARGMTNPQIAEMLQLKLVTIKLYRGLAMEKMQAATLADLIRIWDRQ